MISVVIPLYNKETYIQNTINYVLNQTIQEFEIIIVDDGSSDNSVDIVKSFTDSRIKLFSKKNGGVSSARNLGIQKATYDYVAFLDADDEWKPNHLEEIFSLIKDFREAKVFVTNFARKYNDGRLIANRQSDALERGIILNYFKNRVIHTSCVCVEKKALILEGMFNEKVSRGEDMELWFKLARKYQIAYSPIVTEHYLQEAENSCSFTLPDPEKIYAYYYDSKNVITLDDRAIHKDLVRRRFLRYLILDKNLKFAFKFLKKQYKNII